MEYILKILPKAVSDIQIGVDHYNSQQKGLGKRFASVISDVFTTIKNAPLAASIAYADTRYKVVAKFPYVILYRVIDNTIFIARIFNTHQQSA